MKILESKKQFYANDVRVPQAYFDAGNRFVFLNKDGDKAVLKHRDGGLIFKWPLNKLKEDFIER